MAETDKLTIVMRLANRALSQYQNYNFRSMISFNGVYIGANADGIYQLDSGDDDDGTEIDAFAEWPLTDFGSHIQKRLRRGYVGYETGGSLKVSVKAKEGTVKEFTMSPIQTGQLQHEGEIPFTRDRIGAWWWFRAENVDGCDFSLDSFMVDVVFVRQKPPGS